MKTRILNFLIVFFLISCESECQVPSIGGMQKPAETGSSIPGDIISFVYVNSFVITTQETNGMGVQFSNDGTQMYVAGSGTDEVNQYTLSTAWDLSTANYTSVKNMHSYEAVPTDFWINSDGTFGLLVGSGSDEINAFTFSTPYLASSMVYSTVKSIASTTISAYGITLKDGLTLFVANGSTPTTVQEFSMTTAFDISTLALVQEKDIYRTDELVSASSIYFNTAGTLCYVSSFESYISKYSLSTAFDISTIEFVTSWNMNARTSQIYGMYINPDFTKMYIIDRLLDEVQEYDIVLN